MWLVLAGALISLAQAKRLALLLLTLSLLLGLYQGLLSWPAGILSLLSASLVVLRLRYPANPQLQSSTEALLVFICIGLFLHLFPGFHQPPHVEAVRAGPQSVPFSFSFNFDKALIPFLLLACTPTLFNTAAHPPRHNIVWFALVAAIPLLLCLAVMLGGLGFEPHFPAWIWAFMLANLFFVALAEEAFFRGYLQHRLRQRVGGGKALWITSLLFGLVHFPGGVLLVIFATLAGIIYGLAWHWSGRLWIATACHFAFNMTHLLFFTYPALQH